MYRHFSIDVASESPRVAPFPATGAGRPRASAARRTHTASRPIICQQLPELYPWGYPAYNGTQVLTRYRQEIVGRERLHIAAVTSRAPVGLPLEQWEGMCRKRACRTLHLVV